MRTEALVWGAGVLLGLGVAGTALYVQAKQNVQTYLTTSPVREVTTLMSAPMQWRTGDPASLTALADDLVSAGLSLAPQPDAPGTYSQGDDTLTVWVPASSGPWGTLPAQQGAVTVRDGHIQATTPASGLRLPPTRLASLGALDAAREPVSLDALSPFVVPALLAIEDARFRSHVGIDPLGVLRAVWHNARGGSVHGGSTLTQQLAKNLFLSQERTLRRKVYEVFYAAALESSLTKDELLSLYLSEVYLGHADGVPVHGVAQAARAWFGTTPERLTLEQAATIAGTIAAPNAYGPMADPSRAVARRNTVLDRMVWVRSLDETTGARAKQLPLTLVGGDTRQRSRVPWVAQAAVDELAERAPEGMSTTGLTLYTTVQPHLQRAAQHVASRSAPSDPDAQVAFVSLDPRTGGVLASVGGRTASAGGFDRARRAQRQAGSTVKPLVALIAMAARPHLSPASPLDDGPVHIGTGATTWSPTNADGQDKGSVILRDMIVHSRNTPAVRLAQSVGWSRLANALRGAGLSEASDLPSTALGAFSVTPWQLAGAYTALGAHGTMHGAHVLTAATTADGTTIDLTPPREVTLGQAKHAHMVRSVLVDTVRDGTGRALGTPLARSGHVGGKTGTTDGGRDAWFVAVDPEAVTAVWVGKDRGVLGMSGSKAAAPVAADWLRTRHAPRGRLPTAKGLARTTVCRQAPWVGLTACPACTDTVEVLAPPGAVPSANCDDDALVATDGTPEEQALKGLVEQVLDVFR